jgi:hypothetical protein
MTPPMECELQAVPPAVPVAAVSRLLEPDPG